MLAISGFEIISRSCLDLVFKHIVGTREPFAAKREWIVIAQLADVLQAPLDGPLRGALDSFGSGIGEFEVTPEMESQPVRFVCPACGADSSDFVNRLVRQQFGGEAEPAGAAAAPAPASTDAFTAPTSPRTCGCWAFRPEASRS